MSREYATFLVSAITRGHERKVQRIPVSLTFSPCSVPYKTLEGLFALWLQCGSSNKRHWQLIKGQEEKKGRVDGPGSLPAESQVGRGCMPSLDASWLSGGHPPRSSRSDASSSLWPSGQPLAHPRGLEMSWLSHVSPSLIGFFSACPPTAL